MDSTTDRMPIACVHCAKAKAKCDKKVPCTRCVGKQITCQSRATRRSSQHPNRRNNASRSISERTIQASAVTSTSKSSRSRSQHQLDHDMHSPETNKTIRQNHQPAAHGMIQQPHPVRYSQTVGAFDAEFQLMRTSLGNTPPELSLPITPMMKEAPPIETFFGFNDLHFEPEAEMQLFDLSGAQHLGMFNLNPQDALGDIFDTNETFSHQTELYTFDEKNTLPMMRHLPLSLTGCGPPDSTLDSDCSPQIMMFLADKNSYPSFHDSSLQPLQEPDAVILAQKWWPLFQCNQRDAFPASAPKTASIYLEGLAHTLRNQPTWQEWSALYLDKGSDKCEDPSIDVEPIVGWPREKLLAITQGFLHKALDIHRSEQSLRDDGCSSPTTHDEAFLMLPPPEVMQHFLQNYATRYETYYPLVAGASLNPNALMGATNSKAAALLTLLMAACGASASPTIEARFWSSGLAEACRISLFDLIEKDVLQAREVLILRSAFLFTCLAAWSGDKWHMDMAMGQRGLYLAMLNHSGMLNFNGSYLETSNCKIDPQKAWEDWKDHEGQHKLAHSWVVLDQELSLFSDTSPLLSITDLHTPISDAEELWRAQSASVWLNHFERLHTLTYQSPPSIRDFFCKFVEGDLDSKNISPTNLRLLLHPLQAQVCHLRQFITCLGYDAEDNTNQKISITTTKARLEELNHLLRQWYELSKSTNQSNCQGQGPCWATHANTIMYHLISLNTITSFKCIEQFARKEVAIDDPLKCVSWLQTRCIEHVEQSYFHCGQVLRLLHSLPSTFRPPWWAGAIYRVAVTAWATSLATNCSTQYHDISDVPAASMALSSRPQFAIDRLPPEHEMITRYLNFREGMPTFTSASGQPVALNSGYGILIHCADFLAQDCSMRLTDGIKRKLHLLAEEWKHV